MSILQAYMKPRVIPQAILPAFPASAVLFAAHARKGTPIDDLKLKATEILTDARRTDLIADYHAAIEEVYRRHARQKYSSGF